MMGYRTCGGVNGRRCGNRRKERVNADGGLDEASVIENRVWVWERRERRVKDWVKLEECDEYERREVKMLCCGGRVSIGYVIILPSSFSHRLTETFDLDNGHSRIFLGQEEGRPHPRTILRVLVTFFLTTPDSLYSFLKTHSHRSKNHAEVFSSLSAVRSKLVKYNQFHSHPNHSETLASIGLPITPWDGAAEFYLDKMEDLSAVFGDPEYLEVRNHHCDTCYSTADGVHVEGGVRRGKVSG
jgi:hypothetical protein